ncbi:MAG: lysylphosphatidylglycerol synthase transmembrane domain-containing protein [Prevotella sp.]|nr:lysylphosphatidylglycerol synthase transmembrane domain-containing protein [Prevotella sp.]
MSKKYQNGFFIFGLTVLIIMLTQLDYAQVWAGLKHAGYWFFAVVALWAVLYVFNTCSWYLIIKGVCQQSAEAPDQPKVNVRHPVSLAWLYKVTVSGFALNYATPGGLMGGEPYRIMELAPHIGTERATSSVILYVMTHIFSHFWFWALSILLFIFTHSVSFLLGLMLAAIGAFCVLGIWFFISGYRKGLANRIMTMLRHLPLVKRWARPFVERHRAQLDTIDQQTAALHRQRPLNFIGAVLLELSCRVASALEIYFVLLVLMPSPNYLDCILILAFTSLFANLLFFIPLQLGGREGGFLMSVAGLGMSASAGIFVALIVRIRELVWTGIGLLLIRIERNKNTPT